MSDIQLSRHFFFFLAQNDVPPGYKPILQVLLSRQTRNGLRLKMHDGLFHSNACYIHDPDLISSLPDLNETLTPIVRVLRYEGQDTGVIISSDKNNGRAVLNILEMEILDPHATTANVNLDYPFNDAKPYIEYMTGQVLPPQAPENNQAAPPQEPEYDVKPAKRARIAPNPVQSNPVVPAALGGYRSPSKPGTHTVTSHSPYPRQPNDGTGDQNITPISLITPYLNRWRICGICTMKKLRDVNSPQKGPMRVLEFHLSDETGRTIKMTAWNEQADEINAIVNESQMFYVSGDQGCIRKKNIRFNFTDCDYEINLNRNCQVIGCTDRIYEPPKFSIKRKMIRDLKALDETVDILAVIDKIGEKISVLVKAKNEDVPKRDITLVDDSAHSITLTVWDEKAADNFIGQVGDMIGIKNAKIKEYNGSLTLSLIQHSAIEINPEVPKIDELYQWYENERPTAEIKSLSMGGGGTSTNFAADFRSLAAIKNSAMIETIPHGIYVYAKCEIIEVRKDVAYYSACVKCNKKVSNGDHGLRCDKCSISNPESKMRYMLNINLSDGLDTQYVTLFDEQATELLGGIDAQKLDEIRQNDEKKYNDFFDPLLFQSVIARMRVQNDYYNDQQRKKFTVYQIKEVPYQQYEACLDAAILKLENL